MTKLPSDNWATPKRWVIRALWRACSLTHPIVHHRPWLWLHLPVCPIAHAAFALEERWSVPGRGML